MYIVSCIKIDKNYKTVDQYISPYIYKDLDLAKNDMINMIAEDLLSLYKDTRETCINTINQTLKEFYNVEHFDISDFEFYMFEEYPSSINKIVDEIKDGKKFFHDNINIGQDSAYFKFSNVSYRYTITSIYNFKNEETDK